MNQISPKGKILQHRRKLWPLVGLGLLACICGPLLYAFQTSPKANSSPVFVNSSLSIPQIAPQTDDVLKPSHNHWPVMSKEKLEQTRASLIEDGFSPIQADAMLPYSQTP